MASVPTGGCDGGVRRPPPGQAGGGGGQRHQAPRAHLLRAAVRRAPENRTRAHPQVLQETGEAVGGGSVPVVRTHWFTSRSAASASRPTRRPLAGPLGLPPGSSGGGARGQQGPECASVVAPWPSARWLQGPRAACPQPLRALLTTAGASGLGGAGEDTWGSAGSRGPFSTGVTSAWSVRQCRGGGQKGSGGPAVHPGSDHVCTGEAPTCLWRERVMAARGSPPPGGHRCDPCQREPGGSPFPSCSSLPSGQVAAPRPVHIPVCPQPTLHGAARLPSVAVTCPPWVQGGAVRPPAAGLHAGRRRHKGPRRPCPCPCACGHPCAGGCHCSPGDPPAGPHGGASRLGPGRGSAGRRPRGRLGAATLACRDASSARHTSCLVRLRWSLWVNKCNAGKSEVAGPLWPLG